MGDYLGYLLGAAANLFGGVLNWFGQKDTNRTNVQMARETNEFNARMVEKQNAAAAAESEKQRAYESATSSSASLIL